MHLSATNSERKYETFLSAQRMNCLFFIEGHAPCRMDKTVWICLQKIRHEVWRFWPAYIQWKQSECCAIIADRCN